MDLFWAMIFGFFLDLLLGDPAWMPHPVVWMGRGIGAAEAYLYPRFASTPKGAFWSGAVLAAALPAVTWTVSASACALAARLHPWAALALQTLWCWQALAVRGLADESRRVRQALEREDLPAARRAVSRIVGRDTESLTAEGVVKAAVETVAENFSDGAAAPMLFMLLGGAPLALAYKAVNTMDSMIGYRNRRYLFFGRAAAKLDDAANFLPARIAAWFWIAAAVLTGQDGKGAVRIWRRDARCHDSPNSGQLESACAGALGIRLGGPARYFGELFPKPYIGDAPRPAEPADILRANRMLYAASVLLLLACCAVRYGASRFLYL